MKYDIILAGVGGQGVLSVAAIIARAAVEQGLAKVAEQSVADGASVHMPRIGCGLAGGEWSQIEPLIDKTLIAAGVNVYVYDF